MGVRGCQRGVRGVSEGGNHLFHMRQRLEQRQRLRIRPQELRRIAADEGPVLLRVKLEAAPCPAGRVTLVTKVSPVVHWSNGVK